MKNALRLVIAVFGLLTLASFAAAETADQASDLLRRPTAWCVGGPVGPSYAYSDSRVAQECANRVASFSRACRQSVRSGSCEVFNRRDINAVNPGYCVCNGGGAYVGAW